MRNLILTYLISFMTKIEEVDSFTPQIEYMKWKCLSYSLFSVQPINKTSFVDMEDPSERDTRIKGTKKGNNKERPDGLSRQRELEQYFAKPR